MNTKKLIVLVIILSVIYLVVTKSDTRITSTSHIDRLKHEADSLRNVITLCQSKQLEYDKELDSLNKCISKLQTTISNRERKIDELKRKSNETYTNIPKLTVNDIGQFLSKRYQDSTSTK